MRRTTLAILIPPACALLLATAPAIAGGPLNVCEEGRAFVWPNGGVDIPFNPDLGTLGSLSNAQAVALVEQAFGRWADVPSATVTYTNAGALAQDIDVTNFGPILNPTAPDGISPIVFDDTGEIFDLLFGPGSGVLGFAGPDFGAPSPDCTLLEGSAFLNGPAFTDLDVALDIMVHEFGHYTNLAHTSVNGQILTFGDNSGPTPFDTFGTPAAIDIVETMYPFYLGPAVGFSTPEADDVAILSTLYPEPDFFATRGSISGTILAPNGTTPITGFNVVARNIADPFRDAVSALSSDFAIDFSEDGPFAGTYTLNNLTPGAQYAVYIDQILAGGFSTPLADISLPEEGYNGASESADPDVDDPSELEPVDVSAGSETSGIDVILNTFREGDPLPIGDEGFVELFLPFDFELCGQEFDSVFVNANGSLTFGQASLFDFFESVDFLLTGPPRVAGLWRDLNAGAGGSVSFETSFDDFTVRFENVPEFPNSGSNTFEITLERFGHRASVKYGSLTATSGIAGYSCGGAVTSGFETESDVSKGIFVNGLLDAAVFEQFDGDNDLSGDTVRYLLPVIAFPDHFEHNDSLKRAHFIHLPFDSISVFRLTKIEPLGDDVDYFRFRLKQGETLIASVLTGQLDSLLGLFDRDTGELLAVDDDGGVGLLSRLIYEADQDRNVAIAATTFPDFDFVGAGNSSGRYVLDLQTVEGTVLPLSLDDFIEVPLQFSFPYQGTNQSSVFVNSSGNLTFGTGVVDFTESVSDLLNGPPRIAPLWHDLDPGAGLVLAQSESDSLSISFLDVPEFLGAGNSNFTVTLHASGDVAIDYGDTTVQSALVGISEGGGAGDPGPLDLSATSPLSVDGTTYEQFLLPDVFDLGGSSLLFQLP